MSPQLCLEALRDSNTVLRDDKCSEKEYVDRVIQEERVLLP